MKSLDRLSTVPITVLLVDDHEVMRDMLRLLVKRTPGLTVWGVAMSGKHALVQLSEADGSGRPDGAGLPTVVASDVSMPGMDGLELAAQIRARWPALPCVMFSSHPPGLHTRQAGPSGEVIHMEKGRPHDLVDAIRRAGLTE